MTLLRIAHAELVVLRIGTKGRAAGVPATRRRRWPLDVYRIAPGHDAWVVGDEPAVFVEYQGAANDAKPG